MKNWYFEEDKLCLGREAWGWGRSGAQEVILKAVARQMASCPVDVFAGISLSLILFCVLSFLYKWNELLKAKAQNWQLDHRQGSCVTSHTCETIEGASGWQPFCLGYAHDIVVIGCFEHHPWSFGPVMNFWIRVEATAPKNISFKHYSLFLGSLEELFPIASLTSPFHPIHSFYI